MKILVFSFLVVRFLDGSESSENAFAINATNPAPINIGHILFVFYLGPINLSPLK